MKHKSLLKSHFFIIISLFTELCFAQALYKGVVQNQNKQAIAYANIGIVHKNIGTVSNEKGKFNLSFSHKKYSDDTIAISCIGFYKLKVSVPEFIAKSNSKTNTFILNPKIEELEEIVVVPGSYKTKRLGNKTESKMVMAGFSDNKLGYEVGTLMRIKRGPTFIDSITFIVVKNRYDSVFFRLNIYEVKNKWPAKNILKKPIYISFSKKEIGRQITIDLRQHNLCTKNDFVVTLELVKELGEGGLYFSGTFFGAPTYYRKTSQGNWEKSRAGIGVGAWVCFPEE